MLNRTPVNTPCTNSTSSIAHPLEQNAQEAESYTHAQSHTRVNTELTQAESHAPIVQAQSHPLEQNSRGRELYTWTGTHKLNHTLTQADSNAPIVQAPLEQRATHMLNTHPCEYRTHTSREPCTNSTSSIADPLELKRQRATHGQVHTSSQAQSTKLKRQRAIHMQIAMHQ